MFDRFRDQEGRSGIRCAGSGAAGVHTERKKGRPSRQTPRKPTPGPRYDAAAWRRVPPPLQCGQQHFYRSWLFSAGPVTFEGALDE